MTNALSLEGLETLSELNGAYYKDLPPFLTRRLEERTVKCLHIDSTVDAQVKFDIFERLNTGSIKLESQELRNVTARGPFNDRIKELAKGATFRKLIQVDISNPDENAKVKKMEDAELVLRFFALKYQGHDKIKKGFMEFLTKSLEEFNNLAKDEIDRRANEFSRYMEFILTVLGPQAFAKWRIDAGIGLKKMSAFNAAVYDALAIGIASSYSVEELVTKRDLLQQRLATFKEKLFAEPEFSSLSLEVLTMLERLRRVFAWLTSTSNNEHRNVRSCDFFA